MRAEELHQLQVWLERLEPSARCVFAEVPDELPGWVEQLAERARSAFTAVGIRSAPGAGLAAHLDQAVQVLAEAVLVRYPRLAQGASTELRRASDATSDPGDEEPSPARRRVQGTTWWHRTLEACRRGEPPRSREHPLSVEAERLALCLDPLRLLLVWVVPHATPSDAELLGVARAVEWVVASTRATVLVVLGAHCRGRSALDSISYAALDCSSDAEPSALSNDLANEAFAKPLGAPGLDRSTGEPAPPLRERPRVTALWPVIGQPHPLSPAEQVFAKALAADSELSETFAWNQVVITREQTRPIVDLVWRAGRLIVEIDGFAHHRSRWAFEHDRQRDWELLISGYRVLRLPASEVLTHTARSLEKLRTLTRSIAGETQ